MNPRKNKIKKILLIFLVLIAIILIGLGVYIYMKPTPKIIFASSYDYLIQGTKDLEWADLFTNSPIKSDYAYEKVKMDINFSEELGLGIKTISFDVDASLDNYSKRLVSTIKSKLDGKDLLTFDMYQDEKNTYFTIKDIMDKYYSNDKGYEGFANPVTEEDLKVLTDIVVKNIDQEIKEEDFKKQEDTITLDGKEEKCTKLTLEITEKRANKIFKGILTDIKASDKALATLQNLMVVDKDKVLTEIEDAIKETEEPGLNESVFYNIYYQGTKDIKKIELIEKDGTLTYTGNNGKYELNCVIEEQQTLNILFEKEEDASVVTLTVDGAKIIGKFQKDGNKYTGTIKGYSDDQEAFKFTIDLNKKDSENLTGTIGISVTEEEVATINFETKVTSGSEIGPKDMTNSKPMEEITDEEQQQILANLANHEVIGPIIQALSNFGNKEVEYNY